MNRIMLKYAKVNTMHKYGKVVWYKLNFKNEQQIIIMLMLIS